MTDTMGTRFRGALNMAGTHVVACASRAEG